MGPKKITIEFELDESWAEYADCSDEMLYEDFMEQLDPFHTANAKLVKVERNT